ncbi:MAG TPA: VCBS repeat-containing protein [Cyclobacteriaceae bacterium]|nr:VCBS repeat-containing protein [Cyclobacteriaceae bacterium]
MWRYLILFQILITTACTNTPEKKDLDKKQTLFHRLSPEETGIQFENTVTIHGDFDVFRYRNFYNGGGVAIGDINNDGLSDVYLTSNMGTNKLFLNKGNLRFEDITTRAGVGGTKVWSTGVSMADVNADGLLDIYVCNSGDIKGERRENELFINNGDLTFTEQALKFGLADKGFSTHAAFFDYDKDGDLDCYVLNNSFRPISTLGYKNLRNQRDPDGGDKLYKNENGIYVDVSEGAGIFGSVIGFGLGVTVGDVNQDSWPDIYVSNDFYERDYLYINNKDGTFTDRLPEYMGHISMFSMGADLADLNNDAYPEIFSTDMLPEKYYRLKTLTAFETYDVYKLRLKNDYYHQFMQNMLHMNNKDGTFSEIGQLAGVAATDWSWGALIMDFDNDSNKEIFVSNGIYKDVIDQDFIEYMGSSEGFHAAVDGKKVDFTQFNNQMPSTKLSNYMFTRDNEWQFKNVADEWGLAEPSFSNGAAYGDLDNDGDLELIVNNVNQEVFVYKNKSRELNGNNFLAFSFKGSGSNSFGLGATLKIFIGDQVLYYENNPIRGFQSSMDYCMLVGCGTIAQVDSLYVTWPDRSREVMRAVKTNQKIDVKHSQAHPFEETEKKKETLFNEVSVSNVRHVENEYNDFDRDRLEYHMLSTQGPAIAVADLNKDGRDDFYLGGSVGKPGVIYIQKLSGQFEATPNDVFQSDSLAEDTDALFFDADGDSDLDLYVVSGGSENLRQSPYILDRFYENKGLKNGQPVFSRTTDKLPTIYQSGSCVRAADIDQDGDLDLFVGTRVVPSYYGMPCDQFLLVNDGKGNFTDVTQRFSPQLRSLGMVTDASWFDYDGDAFPDLIIVGEWMPITVFRNDGKQLVKVENVTGLEKSDGWWNVIEASDLNHDGATDFVVGNLGLNSKFKPTVDFPLTLYVNDFDQNGSVEPVMTSFIDGKEFPLAMRQDIIRQMSSLKKKFVYYKEFAQKNTADIFDKKLMDEASIHKFYEARTVALINDKKGGFMKVALPVQAQVSPVYAVATGDFNNDARTDIFLGGNLFSVKPEVGRYDAMHGVVLLGQDGGQFSVLNSNESGIKIEGEVRHIKFLQMGKGNSAYMVVRNNDAAKLYKNK